VLLNVRLIGRLGALVSEVVVGGEACTRHALTSGALRSAGDHRNHMRAWCLGEGFAPPGANV
jgi:hypothetical protein